jgi:hypothetical protein
MQRCLKPSVKCEYGLKTKCFVQFTHQVKNDKLTAHETETKGYKRTASIRLGPSMFCIASFPDRSIDVMLASNLDDKQTKATRPTTHCSRRAADLPPLAASCRVGPAFFLLYH